MYITRHSADPAASATTVIHHILSIYPSAYYILDPGQGNLKRELEGGKKNVASTCEED